MSIWGIGISAAASIAGGLLSKKAGDKNAATAQQMSEADRQFYKDTYNQSLSDNRANQQNDFGSLTWTKDPKTGQWTQQVKMDPASAARLEDFRQIQADRMADAKGGYHTDWNALGFGKLNQAVHGTPGDTDLVHGTGTGANYQPGVQTSAYPSAGGNILHSGTPIAKDYVPGSQFAPPPAPPADPAAVDPSTGKPTIDPVAAAQAAALRQQQEQMSWSGGN